MTNCPSQKLCNEKLSLIEQCCVGPKLYKASFYAPYISKHIASGQFIHLKLPESVGRVLRRPFSVYKADVQEGVIELIYQVVGKGTADMAALDMSCAKDRHFEGLGPLGRGFVVPKQAKRLLLVAGGVGAAPLYMYAQKACAQGLELAVVMGAQSKKHLVCLADYESLGCNVYVATDDGSLGHHGFCTPVFEEQLKSFAPDAVACCGPEPLMKKVALHCKEQQVHCQVSLEKRMACGIGACLSCVVDTLSGKQRSCVDGPVFLGGELVWD